MVVESFPSWHRRDSPTCQLCHLSGDPACELEKQLGVWFVVGTITNKKRSPHWHESGHRCGSHDSTLAVIRTRGIKFSGGHEEHTRGPERREVIVVPASSVAPLQGSSSECVIARPNQVRNLPEPVVARAQPSSAAADCSHHPSGERVVNFGPGNVVPMEVVHMQNRLVQQAEPTTKSHAPVEEHDESLVPKIQRGRPATLCWPSPGSPEYAVGCPGCDGRRCRHLLRCQQKRITLGFSASSSSRDVLGDVVMSEVPIPLEEVPPPPLPAEPPRVQRSPTFGNGTEPQSAGDTEAKGKTVVARPGASQAARHEIIDTRIGKPLVFTGDERSTWLFLFSFFFFFFFFIHIFMTFEFFSMFFHF